MLYTTEKYNCYNCIIHPELFLDKYNRYPLVSAGRERKIQLYKNFRSRDEDVYKRQGIGGGAILNGKIFRGSTGNALEIGHTTISQERTRCGCGNLGCAESLSLIHIWYYARFKICKRKSRDS